jgi:hypothetical protein
MVQLLAAPVMRDPRYRKHTIYFSNVVVHRNSTYHTFGDLCVASWAYNELHSQSGHNYAGVPPGTSRRASPA